jgi:hypothetical protein
MRILIIDLASDYFSFMVLNLLNVFMKSFYLKLVAYVKFKIRKKFL